MTDTSRWPHLAALVDWGVARQPAKPFLTYYDDTTGERVELSYATFGNWVAKTANLLRELGVEPGQRVALWLPSHWQTVVLYVAAWTAGAATVVVDDVETLLGAEAEVVIAAEESLTAVTARRADLPGLREVVGVSLRPLNAPLTAPRPGVTDYADEVLAQGDEFAAPAGEPDGPACVIDGQVVSTAELIDLATQIAVTQQLGPDDRCLALVGTSPLDDGLIAGSLACFVAGSGLALAVGLRPVDLASRVANEKITVLAAPAGWLLAAAQEDAGPQQTRLRVVVARGDGEAPDQVLGAPVTRL